MSSKRVERPDFRCSVCGSEHVIALAPGTEEAIVLDLFMENHGTPQAWCMAHWPCRPVERLPAGAAAP